MKTSIRPALASPSRSVGFSRPFGPAVVYRTRISGPFHRSLPYFYNWCWMVTDASLVLNRRLLRPLPCMLQATAVGNKYEPSRGTASSRHTSHSFTTSVIPPSLISPTTTTSLVSRFMLDKCGQGTKDGPRTVYLPELDMEIVIPPPVQAPRRKLPTDGPPVNLRVQLLRNSASNTSGVIRHPGPSPLPKPPR